MWQICQFIDHIIEFTAWKHGEMQGVFYLISNEKILQNQTKNYNKWTDILQNKNEKDNFNRRSKSNIQYLIGHNLKAFLDLGNLHKNERTTWKWSTSYTKEGSKAAGQWNNQDMQSSLRTRDVSKENNNKECGIKVKL